MSKAKYSGSSSAAKKVPAKKAPGKTAVVKKRKPLLTVALLIVLLSGIVFTLMLFNEKRLLGTSFADVPWYAWLMVVTTIADVVAAIALWYWKRWGLYLFIVSSAARALFMVLAGMIGAGFSALAPAAIVAYLVSLSWKQFE
ncbi:MAG: hypothetical protein H6659_08910 [Ardenticatenaceae bacterium]|nr:hypothetical protein [Ardenticatenaceae bacterium]